MVVSVPSSRGVRPLVEMLSTTIFFRFATDFRPRFPGTRVGSPSRRSPWNRPQPSACGLWSFDAALHGALPEEVPGLA